MCTNFELSHQKKNRNALFVNICTSVTHTFKVFLCLYSLKETKVSTSKKRLRCSVRDRGLHSRRCVTNDAKTLTSTASSPTRRATRPAAGCNSRTSYLASCRGTYHQSRGSFSVSMEKTGISGNITSLGESVKRLEI